MAAPAETPTVTDLSDAPAGGDATAKPKPYIHPDVVSLRCGMVGVGVIALTAVAASWVMFVLTERWAREAVARQLEGGWVARDGTELWFDLRRNAAGTIEVWRPETGSVTAQGRIIWAKAGQAAIAVRFGAGGQDLIAVSISRERDVVEAGGGPLGGTSKTFMRLLQVRPAR